MNELTRKNQASWDRFTPLHLASDFYANEDFVKGATSLNAPELSLLDHMEGQRVLHLQCHFGQDSISLVRMGAEVTAVDFSSVAIKTGRELAEKCGVEVNFIASDVLAPELLAEESFDIVFTSYGAIPWLEDLNTWAKKIQSWLKPGGRLIMVEFHPVLQMLDDDTPEFSYSYFNDGVIAGSQQGSYAARDASEEFEYAVWNHPISEVLESVLGAGLQLRSFNEWDYSPYNCFPGLVGIGEGRYQMKGKEGLLPMVYGLVAGT